MKPLRTPYYVVLALLPLLSACQTPMQPLPGPLQYEHSPAAQGRILMGERTQTATEISTLPQAPRTVAPAGAAPGPQAAASAPSSNEPVSIAIEQTPLPTFIQILYGSVLKVPYTIDPAVMSRTDPVTFKSSQPLTRERIQQLAQSLLQSYGLTVADFDGLVRIAPVGGQQAPSSIPVLRSAESPIPPGDQRPVFQYIELQAVRVPDMSQWLKMMIGSRVTLQEDVTRNSFLLSGNARDVRAALDLIEAMDQPRLRGRSARRFSPVNIGAQDLAMRLSEVLGAQGYAVAVNSTNPAAIFILAIPSISSVLVFARNEQIMAHVQRWVLELDRPNKNAGTNNLLFTYPVKYADAQELARTLGELLGGVVSAAPTSGTGGTGGTNQSSPPRVTGGRVVVNNATNTLIIRGTSPDEQLQIRQLLRELDRPTKSAMIEVVVAELSTGELERLGVQWSYLDPFNQADNRSVQIGGGGLSISYASNARQLLAAINALASDNKGRVLSNPKVMARNGETATISVGRDVPVLTGQQTTLSGTSPIGSSDGVATGVIQTIQYRNTGVNLRVRPVINSGNRLDLEVSQEVSSVAAGETGVGSNPIISNRKIETKLSLRDGSTVLLGGLISRDTSTTNAGVPLLKDIPGLGALFRNRQDSTNQTELLVMITPYVINDDFESEEITAALHKTFGDWAADLPVARKVPVPEDAGRGATDEPAPPSPAPAPPGNAATVPSAQPLEPAARPAAERQETTPPDQAVIELSKPAAAPAAAAGAQGTTPARAAAAPASASASAPAGTSSGKTPSATKEPSIDTPAGPGRPVTDPQVLEELRRRMNEGK